MSIDFLWAQVLLSCVHVDNISDTISYIVLPSPSFRLTALPPTVFCAVCRRDFGFCSGTPLCFTGTIPVRRVGSLNFITAIAATECSDSSCSQFSVRLCLFAHDMSTVHGSGRFYGFDVTVSFFQSLGSADFWLIEAAFLLGQVLGSISVEQPLCRHAFKLTTAVTDPY